MAKKFVTLLISIIVAQLAGAIGSVFTVPNIKTWYVFLEKPFFSPPSWLFGPAWILLYTLMGIAAFLVWSSYAKATDGQTQKRITVSLGIYGIHLVFNTLWSVLFFGFRNPLLGFVDIVILWVLILVIAVRFFKIKRAAGFLFIPYILWVTFAAVLNFSIIALN